MRLFITVAILALLTDAAYAQKKDPAPLPEAPSHYKLDEGAYKDAVKRIPDKQANPDPWGSVRPAEKEKKKN